MEALARFLSAPAGTLGTFTLLGWHVLAAGAVACLILLWIAGAAAKARRAAAEERARENAERLSELVRAQSEMQGRLATMAEVFGSRQAELNQSIRERLDGMTQRLGQSMGDQAKSTHESLAKLQERLAVIDSAQTKIQSLAGQVVELQAILANKQTRGAFGQARMETIIADALPSSRYAFQATLSNGSRPDCVVYMPNGAPSLVIDAKFPLEGWNAMRETESGTAERQRFQRDIEVHLKDISGKYLIPGETQDTAFMFVPSESIFAEIHENFEGLVQKAHRSGIVIVSPSLLMLSVQVIQSVLRDARMREQAHLIQAEVGRFMVDLSRLDERVRKLQTHFGQTSRDIDQIVTSTEKLARRGQRIEDLELAPPAQAGGNEAGTSEPGGEGRLRLRVVDEDR